MAKLITKHRRGSTVEWLAFAGKPEVGELIIETCQSCDRLDDCSKAITEYQKQYDKLPTMCPHCKKHLDAASGEIKLKVGDGKRSFIDLPYVTSSLEDKTNNVELQIAELVSLATNGALPEGYASEIVNARTSSDNITYPSLGEAVRAIEQSTTSLRNELQDFIGAEAVDGLIYDEAESMLYLSSNGVKLEETGVTIVSGSGGSGGGGGAASTTVTLTNDNGTNAITSIVGSTVELKFTFTSSEVIGETATSTGPGSCKVVINNKEVISSYQVTNGEQTVLDITKYLNVGSNNVQVTCTDVYGAFRKLVYSVTIIELSITSNFNDGLIYTSDFELRYTPVGDVEKHIFFEVDGNSVLGYDVNSKPKYVKITSSGIQSTINIPVSKLVDELHGVHSLRIYMEASVNGQTIPSNELYYEFIYTVDNADTPLLASIWNVKEIEEGDLVTIPYLLYDPRELQGGNDGYADNIALRITYIDEEGLVREHSENILEQIPATKQFWSTRSYPKSDSVSFTISYNNGIYSLSKTHTVKVKASSIDVHPIDVGLRLHLTSEGKANNQQSRNTWTYGSYSTAFEGFNWQSNGWVNDDDGNVCLRLNGNAKATINFPLFADDITGVNGHGRTVEIEFAIRNVNDREAVAISCFDGTVGLEATADRLSFTGGVSTVECNYKDETKLRVGITVEPYNAEQQTRFLSIYMNGVLSGVTKYGDSETFIQPASLPITLGSELCELDVYNIRVYDACLTGKQMINNFLAELDDINERVLLYADNNIYKGSLMEQSTLLDYDKIYDLLPTITFTGDMPTYKGDKKIVKMLYHNPSNDTLDFEEDVTIDVQGTSSQGYVRKNWKTKHSVEHQHMATELPARVFCIKVDYAEGTGTHNTQNANFVETLYYELVPPQNAEPRIRTTIAGFPCVIFEKATEDSTPVFSSKGNFNYDKDAENVFGFTEAYDTECWEFCNNDSDMCNFRDVIRGDYMENFEARYHPQWGDWEDADEKGDTAKANQLRDEMIQRFKKMHDWVVSTRVEDATNKALDPSEYITEGSDTYTTDSREYRLAKFRQQFEQHFNLHYATIYYLYTLFALMTDQRAKNMFLTYWTPAGPDDGVWYPYFYDNDTSFGIDNKGHLAFDYFHEDFDIVSNGKIVKGASSDDAVLGDEAEGDALAYVYNGQTSTLWNNFRECFPKQIAAMYQKLRSDKKLTYDKLVDQFITNGADKWSAAIYNEDAEYKYLSIIRPGYTGAQAGENYLYQVRGTGEDHFKYFAENRLMYCDSKFYAGDYPNDLVTVRIYTPILTNPAVEPDPTINITPYSNMYVGVRYKANGYLQQVRYIRDHNLNEDGSQKPVTFTTIQNPIEITEDVYIPTTNNVGTTAQSITANSTFIVNSPEGITATVINADNGTVEFSGDLTICNKQTVEMKREEVDEETGNVTFITEKVECYVVNVTYIGYLSAAKFNDTETFIYGASEISSLGDLSALYCDGLKVSNATKLTELVVGSKKAGYSNTNLKEVSFGSNILLKHIDLTSCPSLTGALDIKNCINIEELYAAGTSITSVELPAAGNVKVLHLPSTITALKIQNQLYTTDVKIGNFTYDEDGTYEVIEDYSNITSLRLENTNLDVNRMLDECLKTNKLQYLRITGATFTFTDDLATDENPKTAGEKAVAYFQRFENIRGYKDNDAIEGPAYIGGKLYVDTITGEQLAEINTYVTGLDVEFKQLRSVVTFMGSGSDSNYPKTLEVLNPHAIGSTPDLGGTDIDQMLKDQEWPIPVKAPDDKFEYTFAGGEDITGGWSTVNPEDLDGTAHTPQKTALLRVKENRTLYPVFTSANRKYDVKFYTGDVLLATVETVYGGIAIFDAAQAPNEYVTTVNGKQVPIKTGTEAPNMYTFTGWLPEPTDIQGPTTCYAQFTFERGGLTDPTLFEVEYTTNEADKELTITNYVAVKNDDSWNAADNRFEANDIDAFVSIPETYTIGEETYTVTAIGYINDNPGADDSKRLNYKGAFTPDEDTPVSVEYVELPDTIEKIDTAAFRDCTKLMHVNIPENCTLIGEDCFAGCTALNDVEFNAVAGRFRSTNNSTGSNAVPPFRSFGNATAHDAVIKFGKDVTFIDDYMFYQNLTDRKPIARIEWLVDEDTGLSKCKQIGQYSFANAMNGPVSLPEGLEKVGQYSFLRNNYIEKIEYRDITINEEKDNTLYLPTTLNTIDRYAFSDWTNLKEVIIPKNVTSLASGFLACSPATAAECIPLTKIVVQNGSSKYESAYDTCIIEKTNKIIVQGSAVNKMSESATSIGERAYGGMALEEADLTKTAITNIGSYGFANCRKLRKVILNSGITSLGDGAFWQCSALTDINLGELAQLTKISQFLFYDCDGLTSITLPPNVTLIDIYAFNTCASLRTVEWNTALQTIGYIAFRDDVMLGADAEGSPGAITLPESVSHIGNGAFSGCTSIKEFTAMNPALTIAGDTGRTDYTTTIFTSCSNLEKITVGFASTSAQAQLAPWGAPKAGVSVVFSDTTKTYN